jgi:hypothetical protein
MSLKTNSITVWHRIYLQIGVEVEFKTSSINDTCFATSAAQRTLPLRRQRDINIAVVSIRNTIHSKISEYKFNI